MGITKYIFVFLLPIFAQGDRCGSSGDWVQYKDEKCYMLTEDFVTAENALTLCLDQDPVATLPVVKSSEEQQFINNYLYVQNGILDGVWLGATRINSTQDFTWSNGDDLSSYSNWTPGHPSDDTDKSCARMVSSLTKTIDAVDGEWEDVACGTRNLVLCQKQTQFSLEEVVQELLSLRFNFNEASAKLDDATVKLDQMEIEMEKIIPVGFLYFQVGTQPSPVDLWPRYSWTDVSGDYEGLFFRVAGGGAAPIGQIQAENSPRLGGVRHGYKEIEGILYPGSISVPSSDWSEYVRSGFHHNNVSFIDGMSFELTNVGEVRPKNTAMRVWKRN